jgi:hypothetical protein
VIMKLVELVCKNDPESYTSDKIHRINRLFQNKYNYGQKAKNFKAQSLSWYPSLNNMMSGIVDFPTDILVVIKGSPSQDSRAYIPVYLADHDVHLQSVSIVVAYQYHEVYTFSGIACNILTC